QGGTITCVVTLSNQNYTVVVPTIPGEAIPATLDRLASAMLSRAAVDNAYNFQPMVDENSFGVMAPDEATVTVTTTDAGLLLSSYSGIVSSFSPLGYWRLNETTQPPTTLVASNRGTLGATGNGTYFGGNPGAPGALRGSADTAARFNGAVVVPYIPALSLNAPFTVEGWFKAAATTTSTPCPLSCAT